MEPECRYTIKESDMKVELIYEVESCMWWKNMQRATEYVEILQCFSAIQLRQNTLPRARKCERIVIKKGKKIPC